MVMKGVGSIRSIMEMGLFFSIECGKIVYVLADVGNRSTGGY